MFQRLLRVFLPFQGNTSLEFGPSPNQTQDEQHWAGFLTPIFLDPESRAPGIQGSALITVLSVLSSPSLSLWQRFRFGPC